MTQVMLAGGLLLEVTQDKWTVSPPRASRVPPIVTTSGPTENEELGTDDITQCVKTATISPSEVLDLYS